jgi:hypothetical protein
MSRSVGVLIFCLAVSGCVPVVMGKSDPEVNRGWTRVEGPVAFDDGDVLRGMLTIDARGVERMATLENTFQSGRLFPASPKRGAEAFAGAMAARTGCRPIGSVQTDGLGEFRMFLNCS